MTKVHVARRCYPPAQFRMSQAPTGAFFCTYCEWTPVFPGSLKRFVQFQQVELRSARLPFENEFLHFGAVSEWTDWLALTGFLELSYSQRAIFERAPGDVRSRPCLSPDRDSLCQVR